MANDNGRLPALLEGRNLTKHFGEMTALDGVSIEVHSGEVVCILGDNGAGKSTLIKILSGVFPPDEGAIFVAGKQVRPRSPAEMLRLGVATLYQDLGVFPLMSVTRNFVVGAEPTVGWGPFRRFDHTAAARLARTELERIGISLESVDQRVGTLSGGERQTLAIARAEFRGARALILDEPTSALGVGEAAMVLRHILAARDRGMAVILITHNVEHALPVGDRFVVLDRGQLAGVYSATEVDELSLIRMMSGGKELERLVRRQAPTSSSQVEHPEKGPSA